HALENDRSRANPRAAFDPNWSACGGAPVVMSAFPISDIVLPDPVHQAVIIAIDNHALVRNEDVIFNSNREDAIQVRLPADINIISDPNLALVGFSYQHAFNQAIVADHYPALGRAFVDMPGDLGVVSEIDESFQPAQPPIA